MEDFYDIEQLRCKECGHKWILKSDKKITGKEE